MTLAAPKVPLVLPPAEARAGDIVIADIGIPGDVLESVAGPRVYLATRGAMRELISPRTADSHKGDYGRVLIVAGSRGKTGAAYLAAVGLCVRRASSPSPTPHLPAILATMAPDTDGGARETDAGLDRPSIGSSTCRATGSRLDRASATTAAHGVHRRIVDVPECRWSSTRRPTRLSTILRLTARGRDGSSRASRRDGAAGRNATDEVQRAASNCAHSRGAHVFVVEGPPHADRTRKGNDKTFSIDRIPGWRGGSGDVLTGERRLARTTARRRGGVPARGLPARPRRRSGGSRRRGSGDDVGGRRGAPRRGDARAHGTASDRG